MKSKDVLKKEYKLNPPEAGIFQIRNRVNGKVFIGSAENVPGILNRHRFELKRGIHRNRELQNDYNLDGEKNFEFTVLEIVNEKKDPDFNYKAELTVLKELWFEKLQPYGDKGYNKPDPI